MAKTKERQRGYFMTVNERIHKERYCRVSLDMITVTDSKDELIVFAYLLMYAGMKEMEGEVEEHDGRAWFRMSSERLCTMLELTRYKHETIMNSLESKGFIQRKMRGNPARRWITIDCDAIEDAVQTAFMKRMKGT